MLRRAVCAYCFLILFFVAGCETSVGLSTTVASPPTEISTLTPTSTRLAPTVALPSPTSTLPLAEVFIPVTSAIHPGTSSYTLSLIPWGVDRYRLLDASGLFVAAIAYADFDRDGLDDIAMAPVEGSTDLTPIRIYRGRPDGGFDLATGLVIPGEVPGAIHARKAIVADFNSDGDPDLYIADHGYDQMPFPGGTNLLLLSDGEGHLVYQAEHYEPKGFHHGASAADIDLDGDVDIFVGDDHRSRKYFLINNGKGEFTRKTSLVPRNLHKHSVYSTELIDVDKDGFVDLLVGGHEFDGLSTRIYWGNGTGSYYDRLHTVLPCDAKYGVVLDFDTGDLDGDGLLDIVITRSGSPPNFYSGFSVQILRQAWPREFLDESLERITGDRRFWIGASEEWIDWIRLVDIDEDDDLDILVDDFGRELAWENDGDGYYCMISP